MLIVVACMLMMQDLSILPPPRLEGEVPLRRSDGRLPQMLGGVPGFQSPRLPMPGEVPASDNTLKIEK
jgi:hypothetical protein